jgi:hypothetical protein
MLATLLHAGHDYSALMDEYTPEEVKLHYLAWLRLDARERRDRVLDMAIAGSANRRAVARHIRRLNDVGKHTEKVHAEAEEVKTPKKRQFNQADFFGSLAYLRKKRR